MKTIPLTQGQIAIVDDRDFPYLSQFKWCACKARHGWVAASRGCATSSKIGSEIRLMHREILGLSSPKIFGHHKNGNKLDNRRKNLMRATPLQNRRGFSRKRAGSTSRFRGVCWHKQTGRWLVTIGLGLYKSEVVAAKRYDRAAKLFYGRFAHLNFPK